MMHIFKGNSSNSEEQEQILLFKKIKDNEVRYPLLKKIYHVPNGGRRDKRTAYRMKLMGLRPGIWDVRYDGPSYDGEYDGLAIEMKVKGNKLSPDQLYWAEFYIPLNFYVAVCYNHLLAWNVVKTYFNIREEDVYYT